MCAKKRSDHIPPCPDPDKFILVKTRDGYYWRRKRGTVKPARLNTVFAQNVAHSKIASPAAKRILLKLQPFLDHIKLGRVQVQLAGLLIQSMNQAGRFDFSRMNGLEFHSQALSKLLREAVHVTETQGEVILSFYLRSGSVLKLGTSVTGFYFEAILLHGDATVANGLRVDSSISRLYTFEEKKEMVHCNLNLQLPENASSWMVILKVSCQEPNRVSTSARQFGMKVVEVG